MTRFARIQTSERASARHVLAIVFGQSLTPSPTIDYNTDAPEELGKGVEFRYSHSHPDSLMAISPTTSASSQTIVTTIPPVAKLSIWQYDRMIDAGVFECESRQRVELLEGVLSQMTPIGHEHENAVDWLARWSIENTGAGEVRVRIQESLSLPGQTSVPEPDIVWVRSLPYATGRPAADDTLLIIEVAKSSLNVDLGKKASLYADAGIGDYWVVDMATKKVMVHREPMDGRYASIVTHPGGEEVQPLAIPDANLVVTALFNAI